MTRERWAGMKMQASSWTLLARFLLSICSCFPVVETIKIQNGQDTVLILLHGVFQRQGNSQNRERGNLEGLMVSRAGRRVPSAIIIVASMSILVATFSVDVKSYSRHL